MMNDGRRGSGGPLFETKGTRLDNGLTVLVRRIPGSDVAAVVTRVDAGYFDEADTEVGISHVLEHMYFKGTTRRGPGDIGREIRAAGGFINAGTIYDRTTYYAVVPADALTTALDVHADALRDARLDAGELERELRVIIEECKRKRDTPPAVVQESLFAAMFDRHRMRRWRMGTEAELARFDRSAVQAFYHAHYRPGNIVVAVVGGIDPDAVMTEVRRLFADMPAGSVRKDRGPEEPERAGFRFRELAGDVNRAYIQFGWHTRPTLHADTPAIDLLGVVLGQGRASRLYRQVRETGLVEEIGASNYTPTELGVFSIGAVAEPADAPAALDAIAGVVGALRSGPPRDDELERARRIVEARLMRRLETVEAQANLLADWQALGDWRLFEEYTARLRAVSPTDLHEAALRYLDIDRAVVLIYRPESAQPAIWSPAPPPPPPQPPARAPSPVPARSVPARPRPARLEDGVHVYDHGAATVVVLPRGTAPLVSLAFAFRAGSNEEPAARSGLTSLMMRTTLKGSATRNAATLAEQVESLGGVIAARAGADAFQWTLGLPARHLADGLDLLSDVVSRPAFAAAELEIERKAVLGELLQVRDDMHAHPFRLMLEAAFEGHRYGAPIEALERTAREAVPEDLLAWHLRTVLDRDGLVLIVGDVDADAAGALAMECLDPEPRNLPPAPSTFAWPTGRRTRVVERDTAQTALAIGFPGPPRNHPDADALQVLAAAVGGLGGRLVEELRSRRSLAYTVSVSPVARAAGGVFAAYIATSPEREDEARVGMLGELARLAAERLPEDEVERARRFLIGSRRIRLQTHSSRLGELAGALLLGRGMEEIRDYEDRIQAVGPEQLRAAAETWLDPDRVAEGVVRGTRTRASG